MLFAVANLHLQARDHAKRSSAAFVNVAHAKMILESSIEESRLANQRDFFSPRHAIQLCSLAIRICPDFAPAYETRATALDIVGDRRRAAQDRQVWQRLK